MKFLHTLITPASEINFDEDAGDWDVPIEPIRRIIVRNVDARHPKTIAKDAAKKAGGKLVDNKDKDDD